LFNPKGGSSMAGVARVSPRSLLLACAVILGFLLVAPAAQAACEGEVLERPFAPWGDNSDYSLVPNGDVSDGAAGWSLNGADVIADNEPWNVHGSPNPGAIRLRGGDSATTAPTCVSLAHPTMRFFLRDAGSILGSLEIEVVLSNGLSLPIGVVLGLLQGNAWAPSATQLIVGNLLDDEVRFRFRAIGLGSEWVIDDVYVDPYKKG
jgi:hypothetical protein